jgi:hypothetical protein
MFFILSCYLFSLSAVELCHGRVYNDYMVVRLIARDNRDTEDSNGHARGKTPGTCVFFAL